MKGIHFLTKKYAHDTGVIVSIRHLCKILSEEKIPYTFTFYEDDEDLLNQSTNSPYDTIDIHVPSFSDDTLFKIIAITKKVIVSIHSTLCNLQVEENAFERLFYLGDGTHKNLYFTCPSKSEVAGFNSVMKNKYLYLPNTFSYDLSNRIIVENMAARNETLGGPVKISLISAYRPMKNMITQMAAISMLAKERDVELHLVDTNKKTPIYAYIKMIAEREQIPIVMYDQMSNRELFDAIKDVHLGLQVSLTETFSYVAMEHMIQGIPLIGSSSVPYASIIADYSDVLDIYNSMKKIIESPSGYNSYQYQARDKALLVQEKNRMDAIAGVLDMME